MKLSSGLLTETPGGFITDSVELEEAEVHLEITVVAWNIAILPKEKRKSKLNKYINKQAAYAPGNKDLEELKAEMKRLINNKVKKYPLVKNKIQRTEVIDKDDEFVVRVYYHKNASNNGKFIAQQGKSTWSVKSVAQKTRNTFNAQLFATLERSSGTK